MSSNNNVAIKGFIDGLTSGVLTGWVFDSHFPEESQPFSIEVDGHIITNDRALCYREDLFHEGFGSGKCGFSVHLGLTISECSGKLIRLLDKHHNPIQDAEYRVEDTDNKIHCELVSRDENSFEFMVTCLKELVTTELSLHYGEACISLMQVKFQQGENTLNIAIPLGIIDGFNDAFSICLTGYSAPLWIANKSESLWGYKGKENTHPFSLLEEFKRESLDLRINQVSDDGIDDSLSAYRFLSGNKTISKLNYRCGNTIEASVVLLFNSDFSESDLLKTMASIILSYNVLPFDLTILSCVDNKILISEVMGAHDVDCNFVYFNKGDCYFDVLSSLNKTISGKYTIVINKPINVSSYWMDELISPFLSQESVVNATTAKVISKNGHVLMPTSFVDINGTLWNTEQNVHPSHPSVNVIKTETRTSSPVWCIKTALFSEGEENRTERSLFNSLTLADIAYIRGIGLDIRYCPQSQIIELIESDSKTTFQSISKKKRVLLIDHAVPSVNEDAGSYAAVQEIKLIQSLGFDVIFSDIKMKYHSKHTQFLQKLGVEVVYSPFYPTLDSVIRAYAAEVSAVYITRYNVAERALPLIKRVNSSIPILFNNADLHFLRELRAALSINDQEKVHQATITRDRELSVMHKVDAILSYNETEHAVITAHLLQSDKIHTCPWVLEAKKSGPSFRERKGIAFLGGYLHAPNVEAVTFFVDQVAPLLLQKDPEIIFYIYGSHVPDSFKKIPNKNVEVVGFIESLDDLYNSHRVFVAPLLSGAGIKGKVLEALAYGLPTVLSSVAAEGIGLSHNITTLQAETAEEWCDEVIRLYYDELLWNRISENQKILAQDKFSFMRGKQQMHNVFSALDLI